MGSQATLMKDISEIRIRLNSQVDSSLTEEATKQWFVMPLLVALGYNPYSTDIIPEFTLDVGVKNGEKVDYALQVQGKLVMIIECKSLNVKLSDRQISQLYRYFAVSDVNIAVLTNGNDYWFFTDSQKANVMDLTPYYTLRMSDITDAEINSLSQYSKSAIAGLDVAGIVRKEKLTMACRDLAERLSSGNFPDWLLSELVSRSDIDLHPTDSVISNCLRLELDRAFSGCSHNTTVPVASKEQPQSNTSGKEKSNIKLNHEYVFNDFSDGDWTFHKLGYAVVFGRRLETSSMRKVLVETISFVLDNGFTTPSILLSDERFNGACKIEHGVDVDTKFFTCVEKYNFSVRTNLSIAYLVKFIESVLIVCNKPMSSVKFCFKS